MQYGFKMALFHKLIHRSGFRYSIYLFYCHIVSFELTKGMRKSGFHTMFLEIMEKAPTSQSRKALSHSIINKYLLNGPKCFLALYLYELYRAHEDIKWRGKLDELLILLFLS